MIADEIPQETILQEIQARYPQEFLISVQAVRISALLNHMRWTETGLERKKITDGRWNVLLVVCLASIISVAC